MARVAAQIAVLGAGHVGPVIARLAVDAGYRVTIAASSEPERIALISRVLAPGAEPRWAADAVHNSDVVVLAIPIHKFAGFDSALVADKLVVDAMNYWPPVDGVQQLFEDRLRGSSEIVSSGSIGRRSSRPSTTSATTNWTPNRDLRARPSAARSVSRATAQALWTSWRPSSNESATTPFG